MVQLGGQDFWSKVDALSPIVHFGFKFMAYLIISSILPFLFFQFTSYLTLSKVKVICWSYQKEMISKSRLLVDKNKISVNFIWLMTWLKKKEKLFLFLIYIYMKFLWQFMLQASKIDYSSTGNSLILSKKTTLIVLDLYYNNTICVCILTSHS